MQLSIVIPVRNEAPNVRPLLAEIHSAFAGEDYEVLFIDDASTDGTFEAIAAARAESTASIRALRLARHGGKSAAYAVGFTAARGELIATMDGDLQDDPRDVLVLRERLLAGPHGAMIGWKTTGKSSRNTFFASRLLNGLLRLLLRLRLHDMNCPLRVLRATDAKALTLHRDYHRYIPLLLQARGVSVGEHPVANRPRLHGRSNYGARKYVSSALALIGMKLHLSFGHRPMALFGGLGLIAFFLGLLICAFVALDFLVFRSDIDDDLPTLILGVLLVVIGTQFLSLGLFAEIVERKLDALAGTAEPMIDAEI